MSEEEEEFETVITPVQYAIIEDGMYLIFDLAEFCEHFDCTAARNPPGKQSLEVLRRSTNKWVDVEKIPRQSELVSIK